MRVLMNAVTDGVPLARAPLGMCSPSLPRPALQTTSGRLISSAFQQIPAPWVRKMHPCVSESLPVCLYRLLSPATVYCAGRRQDCWDLLLHSPLYTSPPHSPHPHSCPSAPLPPLLPPPLPPLLPPPLPPLLSSRPRPSTATLQGRR